ncbi:DeoR/GlpR family DNA-binding transcription regulator [uncultured Holdemanella sp.]|uniref:DeoR/GlpR family DNA-binding transcription regulator n=2 Tax=uncultured Holdemanella sp. TaxID=1763549 RepID=UPI0025EB0847|nr:DeoR/GlpR family DNA-binding transcription regulator [uncultured Holdemanella sp.]
MNTTQRRYEIYEKLKKDKTVQVNELANQYCVSLMTIRRDLDILENQGLATKSYGGATLNESISAEPAFEIKEGMSQSDKKDIAIFASTLIQDGDSIYLDCGTTCLELFKRIHHKKITIFTNFWKILQYVDRNTKAKIIMAPGTYNPITQAALSESTIQFFQNYYIDKAFISVLGIDLDYGVSIPSMSDALVKKAILDSSNKKICLVDHTKFNKKYMSKIANVDDFDMVITDKQLKDDFHRENIKKGAVTK